MRLSSIRFFPKNPDLTQKGLNFTQHEFLGRHESLARLPI